LRFSFLPAWLADVKKAISRALATPLKYSLMSAELDSVKNELQRLDYLMLEAEANFKQWRYQTHPTQYKSACNLLHYLVLRSIDIRALQETLHEYGLSSLSSSESHIRSQLQEILRRLNISLNNDADITYKSSLEILRRRSTELYGKVAADKIPSIMVTFDSSFADDYPAIVKSLQAGMNIARINCSHDDSATWLRMIEHVKRASTVTGLPCKIYMDLPGPKIRTYFRGKNKKKARIKIHEGDVIYLSEKSSANKKKGIVGCTLPGISRQLQKEERVLIDDGLIETKVTEVLKDRAQLVVLRVSSKKGLLKSEKGINLPDSKLSLPPLTSYDLECLPFIQEHADMIGYSFVHNAKDLSTLQNAMTLKKIPVVIKIETPEAVKNFPELLLQGMREELFGIMIARGDLAVEIGFERMSEIQEELLWMCDAAHVPAIWATQVLENLNKSGVATRSEVTDAAHASMAECVMINKGSHIIQVIRALKDILYRSGTHHAKKRYTFRPLSIASTFIEKNKACQDNPTTVKP
jgi:pyruvate kinase